MGIEQILGIAVGPGGVVGVDAVDGDALGFGVHCSSQVLAPAPVIVVAELGPVQGAQDNGCLPRVRQDKAVGRKRLADGGGGGIPAGAQRVPQRRRNIAVEGGRARLHYATPR